MTDTIARPFYDDAMLSELRCAMHRFASLQLRDDQLAEDVVQDAMMAALAGEQAFAGRSALKTWVFAILRNKIIDEIRQRARTINVTALLPEEESMDRAFEAMFKSSGHWLPQSRPHDWGDPEECLHQRQFWVVFDACLEHLPENAARVFMMREFLGFETAEVCAELAISTSNCHVILHRARNALRLCLDASWFVGEQSC